MPSLQLPTLKVPTTSAPWGMVGRCSGGGKITAKDGSLRVDYIEGEVGSDSGVTFHAQPAKFPAAECTLSYQVFFNEHFDWKEGGKLPGLYVGGVGASGGNWSDDCGSARVVFKRRRCCRICLRPAPGMRRKRRSAYPGQGRRTRICQCRPAHDERNACVARRKCGNIQARHVERCTSAS